MNVPAKASTFLLCPLCSDRIPVGQEPEERVECPRCGHVEDRMARKSVQLSMVFSLTALIFYVPANLFPFMTIELYGSRNSSTIWGGIVSLTEKGSYFIALIVFLASIFIPLVKLVILFYLSITVKRGGNSKRKTSLYHFIEAIGRWSMLDIFLLAVLVAILKLGPWTAVEPGLGAVMFSMVVIFTMLASAQFDPRLIWESERD